MYEAQIANDFCQGKPDCPDRPLTLTQKDVEYMENRYDEIVLQADSRVGQFLKSLSRKLLKKTIAVVFSDHGEMSAKHGRFGRAGTVRGTLYDDVIHISPAYSVPG